MAEFRQGWAVVVRDFTPVDGEDADIVTVLRVYWSEPDALAETARLREASAARDCLHYIEATEVEQPLI